MSVSRGGAARYAQYILKYLAHGVRSVFEPCTREPVNVVCRLAHRSVLFTEGLRTLRSAREARSAQLPVAWPCPVRAWPCPARAWPTSIRVGARAVEWPSACSMALSCASMALSCSRQTQSLYPPFPLLMTIRANYRMQKSDMHLMPMKYISAMNDGRAMEAEQCDDRHQNAKLNSDKQTDIKDAGDKPQVAERKSTFCRSLEELKASLPQTLSSPPDTPVPPDVQVVIATLFRMNFDERILYVSRTLLRNSVRFTQEEGD